MEVPAIRTRFFDAACALFDSTLQGDPGKPVAQGLRPRL
jgi:hypothetical protein